MSQFKVFEPEQVKLERPYPLIVMPSILGGNMWDDAEPGRVSDLGQRARELAFRSNLPVLAVQRATADEISRRHHFLGLPRAYDPSEYTQVVSHEAQNIQRIANACGASSLALVGVSSGGERGLAHVEAGLLYRNLFLFDPVSIRKQPWPLAFTRWGVYQAKVALQDATRRPDYPNEHRLGYAAEGEVTGIEDLALHRIAWSSNASYKTLFRLAAGEIKAMRGARTQVFFPTRSFNAPASYRKDTCLLLNELAEHSRTDFYAEHPELPHRYTDDPVRLADMVLGSHILDPPRSAH